MRGALFWMAVIVMSCRSDKTIVCDVDADFSSRFESTIQIVSTRARSDSSSARFDNATVSKAYAVLRVLTHVESHELWEHDIEGTYNNLAQFSQDSLAWRSWYEKNKCYMTMDLAEAVFSKERKPMPDYNNPQVMDRIRELWPSDYADSVRKVDSLQRVRFSLEWPRF